MELLVPIAGLVVLLILLLLLVTSRYKVAGPNQAFIVTGRKGKAVLNPETGQLTRSDLDTADAEVAAMIDNAVGEAKAAPLPTEADLLTDVYVRY